MFQACRAETVHSSTLLFLQVFILTELDALKNDVVNHAKIRASYAEVGQAGDFPVKTFILYRHTEVVSIL